MNIIRFVLILAGAAGLLAFGFPLTRSILNIGNIYGMIVSLLLISAGAAMKEWRWWMTVFLVIVVAFAAIPSFFMLRGCRVTPDTDATVLVLGCRVRGSVPSRTLTERINTAAGYLKAHPDAVCVASGGQGEDEDITEAACIKRELTEQGINPDRIFMEEESGSTRENIENSMALIRQEGLNEHLAIVTNEFHEYRALGIAEKLGIKAGAVPASTALYLLPTFWVREQFGIVYEWVR